MCACAHLADEGAALLRTASAARVAITIEARHDSASAEELEREVVAPARLDAVYEVHADDPVRRAISTDDTPDRVRSVMAGRALPSGYSLVLR